MRGEVFEDTADLDDQRPKTRDECRGGLRPCPWASCRHNLVLDVDPMTGTIKINFPGVALEKMVETCALDVAERGGSTLDVVGKLMNLTRERTRQIEERALQRLKGKAPTG